MKNKIRQRAKRGVKVPSRARIMRVRYALSQQAIQYALTLSILEYNEAIFEIGCKFLEELYPPDTEEYGHLYIHVSRDKRFWDFFRREYTLWELDLVNFCIENGCKLKHWWPTELKQLPGSPELYNSYKNQYLKTIKNVRISI